MTAATVPVRQKFLVQTVNVPGEVGKRLADMGFTSGTEGVVVRKGIFKGPLQVAIRGYNVLIRDEEAKLVQVVAIQSENAVEGTASPFGVPAGSNIS